MTPYQGTENVMDGGPGSIVGWAKVVPDTMRFCRFISPRTNQYITGMFLTLDGPTREVWCLSSGTHIWKVAQGWQRKAYLSKLDKEMETGQVDNMPIASEGVEQI